MEHCRRRRRRRRRRIFQFRAMKCDAVFEAVRFDRFVAVDPPRRLSLAGASQQHQQHQQQHQQQPPQRDFALVEFGGNRLQFWISFIAPTSSMAVNDLRKAEKKTLKKNRQ